MTITVPNPIIKLATFTVKGLCIAALLAIGWQAYHLAKLLLETTV